MANYQGHVNYFGSKDKYAKAIKDKESRGESLSDQAAANAFKKDNPSLFNNGGSSNSLAGKIVPSASVPSSTKKSSNSGTSSSSGVSKTDALISALKGIGSKWGTAGVDNTALNNQANALRSAFTQSGGNISDIPTNLWGSDPTQGFQTGMGQFSGGAMPAPTLDYEAAAAKGMIMPGSGVDLSSLPKSQSINDTSMVTNENPLGQWAYRITPEMQQQFEALGITTEEAQKVISSGFNPGSGMDYDLVGQRFNQLAEQKLARQVEMMPVEEQFAPILSQIQSLTEQANYETGPMLMQYYDQVMNMINTTEASLLQRMEEMGKGVDPATQAALASLKDTINEQRDYLKEEMGSRNLLQSGIYIGEIDKRINKGEQSATQQLLGQRLTDIQNQINSALSSFANARINATSQYGTAAVQAAESAAQRRQEATTNLQNALMKAIEESGRQKTEANKLAWEKEKTMLPWTQGPTPTEMLPYQYVNANTQYTHSTPSGNAQLQHSEWETEWPYKEAQYKYDLNKPYYKPDSDGSGTTKTQKIAAIQQGAVNLVNQLLSRGKQINMGFSGDVGASSGERYTYSGPMSPEAAADEAIKTIRSQIGDMSISYDDMKDVEDLVKKAAGVTTPEQKYKNQYYNSLLGSGGSSGALLQAISDY